MNCVLTKHNPRRISPLIYCTRKWAQGSLLLCNRDNAAAYVAVDRQVHSHMYVCICFIIFWLFVCFPVLKEAEISRFSTVPMIIGKLRRNYAMRKAFKNCRNDNDVSIICNVIALLFSVDLTMYYLQHFTFI